METTSERQARIRQTVCTPFLALSIDDVAAMAGIGVSSLYALKAEGGGPRFKKIGARTVVLLGDYEEWVGSLPSA